jgi:Uma2 family endonuclease
MGNMSELMAQVRHRVSVDDYYKMAAAGIFGANDRVELINGEIVDMAPAGSRHASLVTRLNQLFSRNLEPDVIVKVQDPLHLDAESEPEPDLMLLKARQDFYAKAHPEAQDVLLLVEVGDSTVRFDREIKLPLYARHRVAEVWLIDVEACRVEVCREPLADGSDYAERTIVSSGMIAPRAFPVASVEVGTLFPWRA